MAGSAVEHRPRHQTAAFFVYLFIDGGRLGLQQVFYKAFKAAMRLYNTAGSGGVGKRFFNLQEYGFGVIAEGLFNLRSYRGGKRVRDSKRSHAFQVGFLSGNDNIVHGYSFDCASALTFPFFTSGYVFQNLFFLTLRAFARQRRVLQVRTACRI